MTPSDSDARFPSPASAAEVEEGRRLSPKFDRDGLVTAVVVEAATRELLMVAHMNAEALERSITSGVAHYWSRSRKTLWKKGETSGQIQRIVEMRVDCDQDAIMLAVEVGGDGGCCHTGRKSCFYRAIPLGDAKAALRFVDDAGTVV